MSKFTIKNIGLFFVIAVAVFCLAGCIDISRTAIDGDFFEDTMKDLGYSVANITNQFESGDNIEIALEATDYSKTHKINYYKFNDRLSANDSFRGNLKDMEDTIGNSGYSSSITIDNYKKEAMVADGEYRVITKIDNTIVYVRADSSCRYDIDLALKAIGY